MPQGSARKTYLNFRNNHWLLRKNLPSNVYRRVEWWRFWLDILAALQMLLTGQGRSALAVLRGRRDARRGDVHSEVSVDDAPVLPLKPGCLLWRYYIKGKKTYAEL